MKELLIAMFKVLCVTAALFAASNLRFLCQIDYEIVKKLRLSSPSDRRNLLWHLGICIEYVRLIPVLKESIVSFQYFLFLLLLGV